MRHLDDETWRSTRALADGVGAQPPGGALPQVLGHDPDGPAGGVAGFRGGGPFGRGGIVAPREGGGLPRGEWVGREGGGWAVGGGVPVRPRLDDTLDGGAQLDRSRA